MGSKNQMQASQLKQGLRGYAGEWKISFLIYQKVKMITVIHNVSKIWVNQHNLHKESHDKSVISILMNKTFAHRTHLLVKEFVQLKTLIADYPLLCCDEQLHSEYIHSDSWRKVWQVLYQLFKIFGYFGSTIVALLVCMCLKYENALAFDSSFFLQVFLCPQCVYFLGKKGGQAFIQELLSIAYFPKDWVYLLFA